MSTDKRRQVTLHHDTLPPITFGFTMRAVAGAMTDAHSTINSLAVNGTPAQCPKINFADGRITPTLQNSATA